MEQYGLEELAASAEAVLAGLGPLAAGLARLAVEAGRAVTLDAMEQLVTERGRELLRGVVQLGLDAQADAEVRRAGVAGADGVPRRRAEPGHARPVVTTLGEVTVRRIGYRSGIKGAVSLFPRDAVLNLPPGGYSWALQRLAVMFCLAVSFGQGHEFVLAATGVPVGRRQLEEIVAAAAGDAERFYQDPGRPRDEPPLPAAGGEGGLPPLVISEDAKGVAMRPEARRPDTARKARKRPGQAFGHRLGTGQKAGSRRMAQTGAVFDVIPAPRVPEQVMGRAPGQPGPAGPRAVNRWYACDITAGREAAIGKAFDEAERRDPGHARTWIVLADGDNTQLDLTRDQAAARGVTVTVIIDFIHVLGYLWKAAWCFHRPRDPAIEDWVSAQGLDILHGRTAEVITRIADLAAARPPRPGGEHAKIIARTLSYLENKQPYMDYPRALAEGWPIATGVIEGACRHLIQDRMGITGARWGLAGAQAMLWLRAITASGDTTAYWDWHITQEHQRNHLSRYQPGTFDLAA
ncbi:MAG TPA: ISKra4 family transposase [Streptosporangiaceae bacterium]|nr:ISKra4 family transposase [Streptosporangiaceae bacterium]